MEKMSLRNFAIGNIEDQLNNVFIERKMTNKLRNQIASDIAVIASNAFRVGYYAYAKKMGIELTTNDFEVSDFLTDVTWRIQEAGK